MMMDPQSSKWNNWKGGDSGDTRPTPKKKIKKRLKCRIVDRSLNSVKCALKMKREKSFLFHQYKMCSRQVLVSTTRLVQRDQCQKGVFEE